MKTRIARFLSMLLILLLSTPHIRAEEPNTALTAKQILDRMAQAYASCKSYRDAGVVKNQTEARNKQNIERQEKEEIAFTTAFVRPDRFRFEYKENYKGRNDRYIVWRKGNEVQTWSNLFGIQKPESLSMGVASATGVSGGSAHTIPALLMPKEISGFRVTQMTDTRRIADAKLDNMTVAASRAGLLSNKSMHKSR